MALRQFPIILSAITILLSGCGDNGQERVLSLMEAKQWQQAFNVAQEKIVKSPEDPFFNAVMAELHTEQCIRTMCTETNPKQMDLIKKHLSYVKGPIELGNEQTFDIYKRLPTLTERFLVVNNSLESYLTFIKYSLPAKAPKSVFVSTIEGFVGSALHQGEIEKAITMLETINSIGQAGDSNVIISNFMLGFISEDRTISEAEVAQTKSLFSRSKEDFNKFIENMTYLIFIKSMQDLKEGEDLLHNFITAMTKPFHTIGMPELDTPENNKKFSVTIINLSDNDLPSKLIRMLPKDSTITEEDMNLFVRTKLLHLTLIMDPENSALWHGFFKKAIDTARPEESMSFLYDDIDLSLIPAQVIINNNQMLIDKARLNLKSDLNISHILKEIIYRADAQQLFFDDLAKQLVSEALSNAIERGDYVQAIDYVQYSPESANSKEAEILKTLEKGLNELWKTNQFDKMSEIGDFIRTSLRVPFSLDVALMDMFSKFLQSEEVISKLSTNKLEPLLLTKEEAAIDLGPKISFIIDKFKERPDIIQARLKTLAIEIEGTYSLANTLWSLNYLFEDEDLSSIIANAIKTGIVKDKEITPAELSVIGTKLINMWEPHISLNFIISEVFKRVKNVDDARSVWEVSSGTFKETTNKLRPQLSSLMKGIDLFEAGEIAKAAPFFAVLSDEQYIKEASHYTEKYNLILDPFIGTYFYRKSNNEMHIAALRVTDSKKLLRAKVNMVNVIGSLEKQKDFLIDRGQVVDHTFNAYLNPEDISLTINNDEKTIPDLNMGMERVFGNIKNIKLEEKTLTIVSKTDKKYVFDHVSSDGNYFELPQGRYGITKEISIPDPATSHVLPAGSIINITTSKDPITKDLEDPATRQVRSQLVYPITGTILHPSTREPINLTGFYSKKNHLTELYYSYPMNQGQTILDAIARCHFLKNKFICAGHNKHWSRKRFVNVVQGLKAK